MTLSVACQGNAVAVDESGSCAEVSAGGSVTLRAVIDRGSGAVSVTRAAQRAMLPPTMLRDFVCDGDDLCQHTGEGRVSSGGELESVIYLDADAPAGKVQFRLGAIGSCGADYCVYASDADAATVSEDGKTATVTVKMLARQQGWVCHLGSCRAATPGFD